MEEELVKVVEREYREYVISQVGENKAKTAPNFFRYQYIAKHVELQEDYKVSMILEFL